MTRKVEVVDYDPAWPEQYAAETAVLRQVFGDEIAAIHHVGSTAVPNLRAKPIIDILIEVHDITCVAAYNDAMRALGYAPRGEYGLPGRRYFPKEIDGKRLVHVHIWQRGDPEVARHLIFRDYLRSHPDEARAYANFKAGLAAQFPESMNDYVAGKDQFVKDLEQRALAWDRHQ